jgi:hypothetical protein
MVVTGKLNMFGEPKTRVTRLLEPVIPGGNTLIVETGPGDWIEPGDKLGLPATGNRSSDSETVTV